MEPEEKAQRMAELRNVVRRNDLKAWAVEQGRLFEAAGGPKMRRSDVAA